MLGQTYESQVCSVSRTLEVFGERWTFLIMRDALFADAAHFVEFQRALGIASNVLAARLDQLVESGVMEKVSTEGATREAYRLTARGRDLVPAMIALTEWGDRWAAPDGEPVLYRHHAGAHPVRMQLACDICGTLPDDHDEIEALPGPGMPAALADRLLERHRKRHAA